ncbi:MAG: amidohydrolase [Myxococcales bacterium]|nr:amidohydrolase [Myxococcales bacterium]MCB9530699.1 amidohydrolase [Myxococcales bacterium]
MSDRVPAIDTFVNVNMGSISRPAFLDRVATDYFKRGEAMFEDESPESLLDKMDAAGVQKAVITMRAHEQDERILSFPAANPDRFVLSISLDPRLGMRAVRELEALTRAHPVVLARVVPFFFNLPPNDRAYYPIYTKCCELDLPISVNTGIPGPPAPGMCQYPMHLDDVCLFFPELTVIMAHGADPWWAEAIRLMIKYRNLYLMTSAYSPRYFPQELLHYMNTRGREKIMFASDHPVLTIERSVREARELVLRDGVLEAFLYGNAQRVLFDRAKRDTRGESLQTGMESY